MSDGADVFDRFTITFRALPDDVPAAVRVRRFLKVALRSFGLVNEGLSNPPPQKGDVDHERTDN